MKKSKTIELYICDFKHDTEVEAVGKVEPTGKDVCAEHLEKFTKKIKNPDVFGGGKSDFEIATDPDYQPSLELVFKDKNKG